MSDTWDLSEGQTQHCQACEDEVRGLRATVEHRCRAKPLMRMKRVGWILPDSPTHVFTRARQLRDAWVATGCRVQAIYVREEDL